MKLKTVLDGELKHYGMKRDLKYEGLQGQEAHYDFQVTDCKRPVISVRDCNQKGQFVTFGIGVKKIIDDGDTIAKIEEIVKRPMACES